MRCICLLNNTYIMSTVLHNPQISSKVLLSENKSLELTNTAVFLLRDSVMITQNVTLISNAQEGRYKRWNKIFNPGLALEQGFQEPGPGLFSQHSSYSSSRMYSHTLGRPASVFTPEINEVQAQVKVHLEFCSRLITLTPKSLFPKSGQYRTFLFQPSLRTADVFPVVASLLPKNNVGEPERQTLIPR